LTPPTANPAAAPGLERGALLRVGEFDLGAVGDDDLAVPDLGLPLRGVRSLSTRLRRMSRSKNVSAPAPSWFFTRPRVSA
jgi:hypothetical protein